jgi:hypothetical protein
MARTKLTSAEKMARAGIINFDVDGVLARTTATKATAKRTAQTPEQIAKSLEIAGMGAIVASFIRDRVRDRWTTAEGPFRGYASRWYVFVIPEFERKVGSGRRWFQSRKAMSNQIGTGLFSMSGGMWSGLQARASRGGTEVTIDFRDSTIGQHGVKAGKVTVKRGKNKGKIKNRRATPMIANSKKAGVILKQSKVNVVQPSFAENMAMADAVANKIGLKMAVAMDADRVQVRATSGARISLVRSLRKYWEA